VKTVQLGSVVITRALQDHIDQHKISPWPYLNRHRRKDWGLMDREDRKANDRACELGERVISKYLLDSGQFIYIITEWDRSYTTLMRVEDY
jgi:hypothetical protein